MGVPISFLSKHSPEQFEIIWQASGNTKASAPKEILDTIYFHQIRESLSIVEIQAGDKKTENGRITLPSAMMEMVKSTLPSNLKAQLRFSGAIVDKLERKMNTVNYHDVINQTKNKLLSEKRI